jgi:hypothetical protein
VELYQLAKGLQAYSGSRHTFSALLKSMVKQNRIGLVLTLFRRNSTPSFCAMLPQVVNPNQLSLLLNYPIHRKKALMKMNLQVSTLSNFHLQMKSGVHLLKMLQEVCKLCWLLVIFQNPHMAIASNQLVEAAESWISKLSLKKNSGYPVDSNPNPGNVSFPSPPHLSK